MKKNILRGLASALALAVALVAPNVALAADLAEGDTSNDGEQTITKTYTNTNVDENVTFTFKLAYDHVEAINGNDTKDPTFAEGWTGTTTITFESGETYTDNTISGATIKSLLEGVTFTTPGTYYFTLSEVDDGNPNVSYDTTVYLVKVEVVWATDSDGNYILDKDGNMTVTVVSYTIYTIATEADGSYATDEEGNYVADDDGKQDSADFKNTAATAASLKVTKDIQGAGANPEDTFTFTITVTGVSGTYTYTTSDSGVTVSWDENYATNSENDYTAGSVDTTNFTVTADSNGEIHLTVVMGDDDSFEILGLPVGAEYTVTEDVNVYDTDGSTVLRTYTASATVANDGTDDDDDTVNTDSNGVVTSCTGTISSYDTVAYTNTLDFTADTGITLYLTVFGVVAVVAAAGIALVVVRRRRSYDEF